ncbi:MAG: IS1634 family transposase, partial [Bacillota bacterium]
TEYLVYDTTSISSYSKLMKQVKWGKNKDHDPLPQINLALVYGQESRLPVYYRKLPGNISDVMTVQKMLADIDFLKLDKVQLVMDRGFYSEVNVNALYQRHYKFLVATRIGLSFVQKYLDPVRESMQSRSSYSSKDGLNYLSQTIPWQYSEAKKRSGEVVTSEKRLYLHLFHNDQRAVDDMIEFNSLLDQLEEELLSDQRKPSHESLYARYYEAKKTPKRGVQLTPKQETINEARKNYGYFALISNGIKDPIEALQIYRAKDVIEKAFGNLKERLNMRRTSVSSEENLDGKLFVQFVALIYLAYIDKVMRDNNLYKDYTMQGLLDELDVIELFKQPGKKHHIGEMTNKQLAIYQLFGIDPPS